MTLHLKTVPGWTVTGDSAANTQQTLTKNADNNLRHFVSGFEVATSGASIGADITCTLTDGATVKWKSVIGSGAQRGERTGLSFTNPIMWTVGSPVVLTISAGGAGVVTTGNIEGFSA